MPRRKRPVSVKASRAAARAPAVGLAPRRSRLILSVAAGWALLTCGTLLLFYLLDWRLGQGALFMRFSPFPLLRGLGAMALMLLAGCAAAAVVLVGRSGWRRSAGGIIAAAVVLAIGGWIWTAAPGALTQHSFNFLSPSHDGAFVIESSSIENLGAYLREFDQRLRDAPSARGGTRVLSNPPGITMLAHALDLAFPLRLNPPGPMERYFRQQNVAPQHVGPTKLSVLTAAAVTVLWLLCAAAGYALGRLFLPPPGALLFTLLVTFNASTLNFSPGKDAAQLLTINLMLWAWLATSFSRRACSPLLAAVSGATLVVGAISGLIHIWIALAALAATLWHAIAERQRLMPLARHIASAAGGALVVVLLALAIWRWNILATLLAVTRRFNELQETFEIDRTIHFLIGLPTFLLFVSPALVAFIVIGLRRLRWSLGLRLLICTIAVMAVTYLTGVTYELPRLWIAFLPPLTLGATLCAPLARAQHGRGVYVLAILLLIHFAAAAFNWSLLDVRESEYRLARTERMFE